MPRRTFALCLAGLVGAARAHATEPEAASPEATDTPADDGDALPPSPPPPTLVDAGRRPRPLAFHPTPGDLWGVQIRRASSSVTQVDGAPGDDDGSQTATHELVAIVQPGTPDPRVALRIDHVTLDDAPIETVAAVEKAVKRLGHARLVLTADPLQRGVVDAVDVPEDLDAVDPVAVELFGDAGWALGLVTVPLPDAPVGRGASWTWTRPALEMGVPVDQEMTATLVQRKGDRVVLDLTVAMRASGDAEGMQVTLDADGTGRVWLDLARPLVSAASLSLNGGLAGGWTDDAGDHTLQGSFHVDLAVASRDVGQQVVVPGR
ncbi:MAG: hypothetical protein H6733_09635 [Alphaproteobacteria bacterium]|nr:hypothetical protein [Alphaproteobacteria bacterium]